MILVRQQAGLPDLGHSREAGISEESALLLRQGNEQADSCQNNQRKERGEPDKELQPLVLGVAVALEVVPCRVPVRLLVDVIDGIDNLAAYVLEKARKGHKGNDCEDPQNGLFVPLQLFLNVFKLHLADSCAMPSSVFPEAWNAFLAAWAPAEKYISVIWRPLP